MSRFSASPLLRLSLLAVLLAVPERSMADGPPPQAPRLWAAVSSLDVLAAARTCAADEGCVEFEPPPELVLDETTGQPLLSVHSKGAMDVGPLHDWAEAHPGVGLDEKLVHTEGKTGFEIDVRMDLLDGPAWTDLRAALEMISADAFASLHGIPVQQDGVHDDLADALAEIAACAGDSGCLQALHSAWPWLDPWAGVGAFQIEVPHDGEPGHHDVIAAELLSLSWWEPPMVFAVAPTEGGDHLVRVVGRMSAAGLAGLPPWLAGHSWPARSRPLTCDEMSMVRLQLPAAEAAADLVACAGDPPCHWGVGQARQAVVSPAGRLGVVFQGEDPDIEGLNGLEYPGWSMAPPGWVMDGVAGLLAFEALRAVALGRWQLGEALSLRVDGNPELVALGIGGWLDAWGPDDVPLVYTVLPPDWDGDCWLDAEDYGNVAGGLDCPEGGWFEGIDCDDGNAAVFPGAPDICDGLDDNDCDPASLEFGDVDNDGDGFPLCAADCDDWAAAVHPGAAEICDGLDSDCDGWTPSQEIVDHDSDGFWACADCDDLDQQVNPGMVELCDGKDDDCDGSFLAGELSDDDGDGSPACADCDDSDATIYPAADELCDGADQDCDGLVPVDESDADGDWYRACEECDDGDASVNPGATELCDGADQDCNEVADFQAQLQFDLRSFSADDVYDFGDDQVIEAAFVAVEQFVYHDTVLEHVFQRFESASALLAPRLCIYEAPSPAGPFQLVHLAPMAPGPVGGWWVSGEFELPVQAGSVLAIGTCTTETTWSSGGGVSTASVYPWGWPSALGLASSTIWGTGPWPLESFSTGDVEVEDYQVPEQILRYRVSSESDYDGDGVPLCFDCDAAAVEVCDGFDNDCDGVLPDEEQDLDGDNVMACAGDCDDADPTRFPGSVFPFPPNVIPGWDACDGVDRDCIDQVLEWDQDGDGAMPCEGDCDDGDPQRFPGAEELCDSIDQDCDGDTEDWRVDTDSDGVWDCFDCEPLDPTVGPGLEEICNDGIDQDCDGVAQTTVDADGDGVSGCYGDCDDADPDSAPGLPDVRDGVDNDCDGTVDGFVPAVRVGWSGAPVPAIASIEGFWGPEGYRRPRLAGDYLAFVRRADGTIADVEALDLDPLLGGSPDPNVVTWSDLGLGPLGQGTLWLEADGGVQLVLARREPWEEIEVVLLEEPAALAMPPEGLPANAAGGWGTCEWIGSRPTVEIALEDMEHADYFPWMEFDAPSSEYDFWLAQPLPPDCSGDSCKLLPTQAQLSLVCRALRHSSPAVAASVSQIDWWSQQPMGEWEKGRADGSRLLLHPIFLEMDDPTTAVNEDEWIETVAHEAAHAYTDAVSPAATTIVGDFALQGFVDGVRGLFRNNLQGVLNVLAELVMDADATTASGGCALSMNYHDSIAYEVLNQGSVEDAFACGFRSGTVAAPFYTAMAPDEDIAGWVADSVVWSVAGNPAGFCLGLPLSPAELPQTQLVHFAKLAILRLGGFLAPAVAEGCLADLVPDWPARPNELWSETSRQGLQFSVGPVSWSQSPSGGVLSVQYSTPAQPGPLLLLMRGAGIPPWTGPAAPLAFAGTFPMDVSSWEPSPEWTPTAPVTTSYFGRTPPSLVDGAPDHPDGPCYYGGPAPGIYGRSTEGALVLIGTGNGWRFGAAIGTPLACGWNPTLLDVPPDPNTWEEAQTEGVPVFFSVGP